MLLQKQSPTKRGDFQVVLIKCDLADGTHNRLDSFVLIVALVHHGGMKGTSRCLLQ